MGKPIGIWGVRGDAGAIRRGFGFPISSGFKVFPPNIEMMGKTKKHLIFQNLYEYNAAWVTPGSSWGLFFRHPELRKVRFFQKKVRKHEKLEVSVYLQVLDQKQHL